MKLPPAASLTFGLLSPTTYLVQRGSLQTTIIPSSTSATHQDPFSLDPTVYSVGHTG